jgi:hypothetical protein
MHAVPGISAGISVCGAENVKACLTVTVWQLVCRQFTNRNYVMIRLEKYYRLEVVFSYEMRPITGRHVAIKCLLNTLHISLAYIHWFIS